MVKISKIISNDGTGHAITAQNFLILFGLAFALLFLSACDGTKRMADRLTPDVISDKLPQDWFGEEGENQANSQKGEIPSDQRVAETYPKLQNLSRSNYNSGVKRDFDALENQLRADRQNAVYTDQELRKMVPPLSLGVGGGAKGQSQAAQSVRTKPSNEQTIGQPKVSADDILKQAEANNPVNNPANNTTQRPVPRAAPQTPIIETDLSTIDTDQQPNDLPNNQSNEQSFDSYVGQAVAPAESQADAQNDGALISGDDESLARANSLPDPELSPPDNTRPRLFNEQAPPEPAPLQNGVMSNVDLNQARLIGPASNPTDGRLVANLFYRENIIELDPDDDKILREIVRFYQTYDVKNLYIVGHASPSDSKGYTSGMMTSFKVALDRATYVGERLNALGIPLDSIQINSKGARHPIYSEITQNGVIGNRRVAIYVEFQ